MRDQLGIMMSIKVNLYSEKAGGIVAIERDFGVNNLPSKAEVDAIILDSIATGNETFDVDDCRLTTMSDFGFANPKDFGWKFGE